MNCKIGIQFEVTEELEELIYLGAIVGKLQIFRQGG